MLKWSLLVVASAHMLFVSPAQACYHFKIWHYPYPQRCSYQYYAPVKTLVKPEVKHLIFPTFDRLGLYYRDWRIWKAEQIEIPDAVKK